MAKDKMEPLYLETLRSGQFDQKIEQAYRLLEDCRVCPRECRVNRRKGELGICKIGELPRIASYHPHFGEEAPLVGRHGSGTIFISSCNLLCKFCQNFEISHLREGREVSIERFAEMMLELQAIGCHNINIVTPSHIVPQLIHALKLAAEEGLRVPLVYNSSAYDSLESLRLLEGIVDIYMPDFKFASDEIAARYTGVKNYATVARAALKEMHRQVGDLQINEEGLAVRGLLVRHLVMPGYVDDSIRVLEFLAREISTNTYLNIMDQYHPCGRAHEHPEIDRPITYEEYRQVVEAAQRLGFTRLDQRYHRAWRWF